MVRTRASVFDEPELDVSDFRPKPAQGVEREQVRAVAEPASFRSREALPAPPSRREPRRHRTGRNVQLNLKVRQEDVDAFYAIADQKGWVLGEAFEKAVQALKAQAD